MASMQGSGMACFCMVTNNAKHEENAMIEISFPGGKRVDAKINGHTVATDQPSNMGGESSAPAPFDLFLSSIATCAGIYALSFCQNKDISTEGMALTMKIEDVSAIGMIGKMIIDLKLPEGFPEKYKNAITRAMGLCSVKKHMFEPPEFEITAS